MPTESTFREALLAIEDGYVTSRWNFPAAVGTSKDAPGGIGTAVTLSYSFLGAAPAYLPTTEFRAFTAAEQQATRDALQSWSAVARITLQEVGGVGQLTFGMNGQAGSSGYAYFPGYGYSWNGSGTITSVTESNVAGDVWLNSRNAWTADDFAPGRHGHGTLVHEIGHALGLKHSFDSDNGGAVLDAAVDHVGWTVMSYTEHPHGLYRTVTETGGGSYTLSYRYIAPETPMIGDIAAMQALYGANTAWRAGDDTYTFDPARPFLRTIWDGGGYDTISVANFTQGSVINLEAGTFSSIRVLSDALPPGATETRTDLYDGSDNLGIAYGAVIEAAIGGSGADTLLGNGVANRLAGNGGTDVLQGFGGQDYLDGGSGADTMTGGTGNDTYIVDDPGDRTIEAAGGGTDGVQSSISWMLASEVELLVLTGNAAINGTGNALANTLLGNAAVNNLNGGAGADTMSGGGGNDVYTVDHVGDIVVEAAGGGIDRVKASLSWTLGAEVENLTLTGSAAINGTGNALANSLVGNSGANVLDGRAGADTMSGGAGSDTYVVDHAGDTVTEAAGGGIDTVRSSITWTLGAEVDNLELTGSLAINGSGNALANRLVGNAAANVLTAGSGSDVLTGGGGADTFVLNNLTGSDTITDFAGGVDKVRIRQSTITVGDGDTVVEGATTIAAPGGFARGAELVIVTANIAGGISTASAAAAIGSATSAYAIGASALFAVDNGSTSVLYLFRALDADAAVEAGELTLLAKLNGTAATSTGDYLFG